MPVSRGLRTPDTICDLVAEVVGEAREQLLGPAMQVELPERHEGTFDLLRLIPLEARVPNSYAHLIRSLPSFGGALASR